MITLKNTNGFMLLLGLPLPILPHRFRRDRCPGPAEGRANRWMTRGANILIGHAIPGVTSIRVGTKHQELADDVGIFLFP